MGSSDENAMLQDIVRTLSGDIEGLTQRARRMSNEIGKRLAADASREDAVVISRLLGGNKVVIDAILTDASIPKRWKKAGKVEHEDETEWVFRLDGSSGLHCSIFVGPDGSEEDVLRIVFKVRSADF